MTAFVGQNGLGKTNILEALFMLTQQNSFRTSRIENCIRHDCDSAFVRGEYEDQDGMTHTAEIRIPRAERKRILLDGKAVTPQTLRQQFGVVIFSPRDHELIKDSSAYRRAYLDSVAESLFSDHRAICLKVAKILRQRAAVLKSERVDANLFDLWTRELIQWAPQLIENRMKVVSVLSGPATTIYRKLSGKDDVIELVYQDDRYGKSANREQIQKTLEEKLRQRSAVERVVRRNLVGPHVDNISILLNKTDSREFASQGQSRSLIIALKLAHAQLIREQRHIHPLFIADDISSELDENRRKFLLNYLLEEQIQVFFSSADAHFVPMMSKDCQLIEVIAGPEGPQLEQGNEREFSTIGN